VGRPTRKPQGTLEFLDKKNGSWLSRQVKDAKAQRLAPGIYAIGSSISAENVVRQYICEIVNHVWAGAVIIGKTARGAGLPVNHELFVAQPELTRKSPLQLPGVIVYPVQSPGALKGDIQLPNGLYQSSTARTLIENVDRLGRRHKYRGGNAFVEDIIDEEMRIGGSRRIKQILDNLAEISSEFDYSSVINAEERLKAVLNPLSAKITPSSERLASRLAGEPFDADRIDLFSGLVGALKKWAPYTMPASKPDSRWEWEPFFEAYFSNFIEGTKFTIEEAYEIVVRKEESHGRPADAHDITATFELASDIHDRVRVPNDFESLKIILKERHQKLMSVRMDLLPGEFKTEDNFAGGYRFVEHQLLEGTLRHGFELINTLSDAMSRAVGMMVLITECHPFRDGNGRIARLMANSELSRVGEVRVVIPTIYRDNYISGLSGFSNRNGQGEPLRAIFEFAQKWTSEVDWSSFDLADKDMQRTNAYLETARAESKGLRLRLPGDVI